MDGERQRESRRVRRQVEAVAVALCAVVLAVGAIAYYFCVFTPKQRWEELEARRIGLLAEREALESALEAEDLTYSQREELRSEQGALRAKWPGLALDYATFAREVPGHPKSVVAGALAAAMGGNAEQVAQLRAEVSRGRYARGLIAALRRWTADPLLGDLASELVACAAGLALPGKRSPDTLIDAPAIAALEAETGRTTALPVGPSQRIVRGSQVWRHDLDRVAFATVPAGELATSRWTVWVADFRAGRLHAFLPAEPLPDLVYREGALLSWSKEGAELHGPEVSWSLDHR